MSRNEIRVYLWWCGDEECDCTKPVVDIRYEKPIPGIGVVEQIWEGTFISRGYGLPDQEEIETQRRELKDAREWYHQPARAGAR